MPIEFIRDEFLEGKKEELDKIDRDLSVKPKKKDVNALFLKRFTLALMGQYAFKKRNIIKKHEEIDFLNKRLADETRKLNEFRTPIQRIMPQPPMKMPSSGLNVPIPKVQLKVPEPLKEGLRIPRPVTIEKTVTPNKNEEIKKEISTPKPL